MRYVKTIDAKPGSIIARSVYAPDGQMLVAANTELTPYILQRLSMLGYQAVYLFDAGETKNSLIMSLDEGMRIRAAKFLESVDLDKCAYIANQIVQQVLANKDTAAEVNRISGYDLCTWMHSVDVCTYSVMCGMAFGYSDRELAELSQAALLHDIGKTMVSFDILNKPAKLTPDEFALMKNHPEYGWDLLRHNTSLSVPVYASVYEHHENEDGTGYPRGVSGKNIYRYAKIIHVADVYEACTAMRPYKKPMNPADALENLMSGYGTVFDKDVVNVFRSIVVLYPVGRTVLLSDGRTGTVIENRRSALQRPVVKLDNGDVLDLLKVLNVTILGLVD